MWPLCSHSPRIFNTSACLVCICFATTVLALPTEHPTEAPIITETNNISAVQAAIPHVNYDSTIARLLPLAKKGNADAAYNVALSYEHMQRYTEAFYWYAQAGRTGNTDAQNNLGMLYHEGTGVAKDVVKAKELFLQAAEKGNNQAQTNLGVMLSLGETGKVDLPQAIEWYKKAAMQGNALAQSNLGFMYYKGLGVKADNTIAFKLFSKAAVQQHPVALYNLGLMYNLGQGVPQNKVKAYTWWLLAARNGDKDARNKLGLLSSVLTSEEIKQATLAANP